MTHPAKLTTHLITFEQFCTDFEAKGSRVIFQFRISRAGSSFLHSLFDNHPEILTYPGPVDFYTHIWQHISTTGSPWKEPILAMVRAWKEASHNNFHRELGPNRNETIHIDENKLIAHIESAVGRNCRSRRLLFLAFHYAVGLLLGKDLSQITTLYQEEHSNQYKDNIINAIFQDFPKASLLCIVRDPRSVYPSLKAYRHKLIQMDQKRLADSMSIRFHTWHEFTESLTVMNRFENRFKIIRLEDIQQWPDAMMRELATLTGIHFHPSLLTTTFDGKLWWGDEFSPPKPGFRPFSKPVVWTNNLNPVVISAIEIVTKQELAALGYRRLYKPFSFYWFLAWLSFPFWCRDDEGRILYRASLAQQDRPQSFLLRWLRPFSTYIRTQLSLLKQVLLQSRQYPRIPQQVVCSPDRSSLRAQDDALTP